MYYDHVETNGIYFNFDDEEEEIEQCCVYRIDKKISNDMIYATVFISNLKGNARSFKEDYNDDYVVSMSVISEVDKKRYKNFIRTIFGAPIEKK